MKPAWRLLILLITAASQWQCRDVDAVETVMEPATSSCPVMMGRHMVCGVCSCCIAPRRIQVLCEGSNVTDIPQDLPINTTHLTFFDTGIVNLTPANGISKLSKYTKIGYLSFNSNQKLTHIAPGAFMLHVDNVIDHLAIHDSPLLQDIPPDALISFYKLQTLKITHCGLVKPPDWSFFYTERKAGLVELDLSGNKMVVLKSGAFSQLQPVVGILLLDDNSLESIEGRVFAGAKIGHIKIRRNKQLKFLHEDVFVNATSLQSLDLSQSSIVSLPTRGLEQVVNLTLQNVLTLKVFPPVLRFSSIKSAQLTYSQHCCALAHPEKQDEQEWKEFIRGVQRECVTNSVSSRVTMMPHWAKRSLLSTDNGVEVSGVWQQSGWHAVTLNPNETYNRVVRCGFGVVDQIKRAKCTPQADAFNPCEDVMGHVWLRLVIWVVIITALLGNLMVLAVTLSTTYRLSVSKFLICNLALADLTLGLYLLVLAAIDLHTRGVYFNHAIIWQLEGGCQAAGFLAIFSTCLSVATLTVITLERWYAIRHAIQLTRRLRLRPAAAAMAAGWIFSIVMATLPLLGVSSYGKTSICLPMETETTVDLIYVLCLLLLSAGAFFLVCACYVDMYRQVRGDAAGAGDATVAKRMALLIFTDFACLFPLAFFGLTAAAGKPLVTVTDSKILVVLCFPLNSCANPFLYALFTKQFRHDLYGVFSRCGVCERRVTKHRTAGSYVGTATAQNRKSNQTQRLLPCCLQPASPQSDRQNTERDCNKCLPKNVNSSCWHHQKRQHNEKEWSHVNGHRLNALRNNGMGDNVGDMSTDSVTDVLSKSQGGVFCPLCDARKASKVTTLTRFSSIYSESPEMDCSDASIRRLTQDNVELSCLGMESVCAQHSVTS